MSDLLNIGASGVKAYGKALSVVGENIANANSAGYARRDVQLSPQGTGGTAGVTARAGVTGSGVMANGIARSSDAFRIADSRLTAGDAARSDARATWLAAAETALPDDAGGIGTALTSVYTAGDALAADPAGAVPRQQFLDSIDRAAGALRTGATGLAHVADGVADAATQGVATLNGALASLVKINVALLRTQPGTTSAANLSDQRDAAIDAIAGQAGVDVAIDPRGLATVTLAGSSTTLVAGAAAADMRISRAADGRLSLATDDANGVAVAVQPTTGALSGLLDASAAIAGRRRQLDGVATDFAVKLNGWSAAGKDANGIAGGPLLDAAGGAAALSALVTDPDRLAAASDDAANGNALTLSAQRGPNGVEARAAALVSFLGQTVSAAKAEASAASSRSDASALAREQSSGVDLDREAADLLRFQQAYSGAAKVIQTARESLQTILNLF